MQFNLQINKLHKSTKKNVSQELPKACITCKLELAELLTLSSWLLVLHIDKGRTFIRGVAVNFTTSSGQLECNAVRQPPREESYIMFLQWEPNFSCSNFWMISVQALKQVMPSKILQQQKGKKCM